MLSRRALLAGGVSSLAAPAILARAQNSTDSAATAPTILRLERRDIEMNGKTASVYAIRQPNGTFGLTTEVGKSFRVRVENGIGEPSLIHWHGLTPPWRQDGVPGISGPPIPAGGSADYDFPLRFGGTFWMHSHQGLQEQGLMTAPLIIHDERDRSDEQEVVVMLADFSFTPAEQIFENLKKLGLDGGHGQTGRGHGFDVEHEDGGPMRQANRGPTSTTSNMTPSSPISARSPTRRSSRSSRAARVLLRIINSSSMSAFHVGLGALDGELIAVDGFEVEPIRGRTFPVAVAQRLDIRVSLPPGPGAYPVLAQLEGERSQTGIILVAGGAPVTQIPDAAEAPSPPLNLDLERSLRAKKPLAPRKADRVHTLNLTGEMAGYVWSINNVVWNKDTPPLAVAEGERVELVFVNQTPMPHPMHLHGHEFQVVEIDGERFPGAVRDTILVTPGRRVVVAFDANNPGWWALHCHLLYHLDAGMFTTIRYV